MVCKIKCIGIIPRVRIRLIYTSSVFHITSSQKDNVAEEKEWQGIAKYLPMINNERVYLFYKMVVKLFHARKD